MLHLYTSTHCQYCHKVRTHFNDTGIAYVDRNVELNPEWRNDVLTIGGKMQVPFLVDTERNVSIFDSDDIIAYGDQHHGNSSHAV